MVTIPEVQPERPIVAEHAPDLAEHLDEMPDVLLDSLLQSEAVAPGRDDDLGCSRHRAIRDLGPLDVRDLVVTETHVGRARHTELDTPVRQLAEPVERMPDEELVARDAHRQSSRISTP
jgi:hypothetical protein